jgi:hypothetical protein
MNSEAAFPAAVIASQRRTGPKPWRSGAKLATCGSNLAANQWLLSSSTVGFGGGDEAATAPTGTVGANFSILAETLRQRSNCVVTN